MSQTTSNLLQFLSSLLLFITVYSVCKVSVSKQAFHVHEYAYVQASPAQDMSVGSGRRQVYSERGIHGPLCILPYKLGTRPDREKCARRQWAQLERQHAARVTGTPLNDTSVHVCRDEVIREVDGVVYKVTNLWDKERRVKPTATQYTCP